MDASEQARILMESVAKSGTSVIFGMPGGGNNLELVGAAERAGLQFVLCHLETTAAIMAATYADLTRTPTPCVVTRGPGAASAVNGIAQALLDRQPLLLFTDTVSAIDAPRVTHQRLDQRALFAEVSKLSVTLGNVGTEATVNRAIEVAMELPRGPVHIDIDLTQESTVIAPRTERSPTGTPAADLEAVAELVRNSQRPVVVLGVGSRDAVGQVRDLLRNTEIPALTTYRAKGVVPDSWDNAAGLFTGATLESTVLEAADLILAIGLDTVELIPNGWPYDAPVVSLSGWADEASYFPVEVEVIGDIAASVAHLVGVVNDGWDAGFARRCREDGLQRLLEGPSLEGLSPQAVVQQARALAPADCVATVDSGAHMLVAMPLWTVEEPDQLLISSGLATMGYALPAAIAASLANPDRRVVCLVGDGGLGMTLSELETIVRLDLPITTIVFNDSALSLIAIKQHPSRHGGPNAVTYRSTDFSLIAQGHGMAATTARTTSELEASLRRSFAETEPNLIDVRVDPRGYPYVIDTIRGRRS